MTQVTGIIEKVEFSEWVAPVIPVPKPDDHMQLCGDYKVTVNTELQVDQYPLPNPEDLYAILTGGKHFTKLDLKQTYQQIVLEKAFETTILG